MNKIRDRPNTMIATKKIQYACAVALILTSIVMVAYVGRAGKERWSFLETLRLRRYCLTFQT